jgi:hypothetical protein
MSISRAVTIEVVGKGDIPDLFRNEFHYFLKKDPAHQTDIRFIFDSFSGKMRNAYRAGLSKKNNDYFEHFIEHEFGM